MHFPAQLHSFKMCQCAAQQSQDVLRSGQVGRAASAVVSSLGRKGRSNKKVCSDFVGLCAWLCLPPNPKLDTRTVQQGGKSSTKLAIEIPVADDTALVEVAQQLLSRLPSPYDRTTAVVCWDDTTATAARSALPGLTVINAAAGPAEGRLAAKNLLFLGLRDSQVGMQADSPLHFFQPFSWSGISLYGQSMLKSAGTDAPTIAQMGAQVGAAKRVLAAATGSLALLLRTSTEAKLSAASESFVQAFAVSYSFQPVAIKVLCWVSVAGKALPSSVTF